MLRRTLRLLYSSAPQSFGQWSCGLDQNILALPDCVVDELLGEQLTAAVRAQSELFVPTFEPNLKESTSM